MTNDVVFWVRNLIGDADEVMLDDGSSAIAVSGRLLGLDLIPAPPAPGVSDQGDERDSIDELRAELEAVAEESELAEEFEVEDEDDGYST